MFAWENNFESHILDRGWQYMQAGAVSYLIKRDNEIDALVQGSECYNVHIRYDGHAVSVHGPRECSRVQSLPSQGRREDLRRHGGRGQGRRHHRRRGQDQLRHLHRHRRGHAV